MVENVEKRCTHHPGLKMDFLFWKIVTEIVMVAPIVKVAKKRFLSQLNKKFKQLFGVYFFV